MRYMIIDGSNKCYSYAHATKFNVSMFDGLTSIIAKAYREYRPDVIVMAWESRFNIRGDIYPTYKEDRGGLPDEIHEEILQVKEYLKKFGIVHATSNGYEADDVIATLAKNLAHDRFTEKVMILSEDKDLYQCLTDPKVMISSSMTKIGKKYGGIIDKDRFIDHFGFDPKYFAFYQFLIGDKSDSIIGIPGIGPKKAAELIKCESFMKQLKPDEWHFNCFPEFCRFDGYVGGEDAACKIVWKILKAGQLHCQKTWFLINLRDECQIDFDCQVYDQVVDESIKNMNPGIHNVFSVAMNGYTSNIECMWMEKFGGEHE